MKLTVHAEGHRRGDLELALEETLTRLRAGNTSGFDRNESGSFSFEVDGSSFRDTFAAGRDRDLGHRHGEPFTVVAEVTDDGTTRYRIRFDDDTEVVASAAQVLDD